MTIKESQENKRTGECRVCKANGFPNQLITFKSEGIKSDGRTNWVLYDDLKHQLKHIHKTGSNNNNISNKPTSPAAEIKTIDSTTPLIAELVKEHKLTNKLLEEIRSCLLQQKEAGD